MSHCLVQENQSELPPEVQILEGNIFNKNPLFIDETNEIYQLQTHSPCINTGNSNIENLPETDLAENPRISGSSIDIGAYEFQE